MSLAVRVIPVMLCKRELLVKGERFQNDRVVGHVEQAARVHAERGVDELLILDVTARREGRLIDPEMVKRITTGCFTPVTVGGGVRSREDVDALLRAGADKVLVGSIANEKRWFLRDLSDRFGSQAIVASVNWPSVEIYEGVVSWKHGAGEILLNNSERDGTMSGYNLALIAEAAHEIGCPVIACGGCSGYPDMLAAVKAGASAVAAGALYQFTDATPREAAEYLKANGIDVRLP